MPTFGSATYRLLGRRCINPKQIMKSAPAPPSEPIPRRCFIRPCFVSRPQSRMNSFESVFWPIMLSGHSTLTSKPQSPYQHLAAAALHPNLTGQQVPLCHQSLNDRYREREPH